MDLKNWIVVTGARENNLKNINVNIPKDSLVVFTGVSGSGKSTLAFDTIFAEGQRRYIESLSSYARMFLGGFQKPDVDSIDGLQPAISIDQKTTSHNPRSTVGTVTEIYDYLRLLWARIGVAYCPPHNLPIKPFSLQQIADIILKNPLGSKISIFAPVVRNEKGTHIETIQKFMASGDRKMKIDGAPLQSYQEAPQLDKKKKHSIDFHIDTFTLKTTSKSRVFDSLRVALDFAKGYVIVQVDDKPEVLYSEHSSCPICGFTVPPLEPRLFSFNNPLGACQDCKGMGIKISADPTLIVPDNKLSINEGAIKPMGKPKDNKEWFSFQKLCKSQHINMDVPFYKLSERQKKIIFYGPEDEVNYVYTTMSGTEIHSSVSEGIKTRIDRLYATTTSTWMKEWYETFMTSTICPTCHGARLNDKVLSIKVGELSIFDATNLSLDKLLNFFNDLNLSDRDKKVSELVLKEIKDRLGFLVDVGLDYLTLSRMSMTLSGGESQRIRLATQIGSKLTGVLYVLDEPSIGLHQKDNDRLITSLKEMRDLGNSLIVVEHDEDTIRAADYIVDIGPSAGKNGGKVVACGQVSDLENSKESITGDYLAGRKYIPVPDIRRKTTRYLTIEGARCHNLKNVDVKIPLGEFVCVTGVSGSGKSSLINEVLYKNILAHFGIGHEKPGECNGIKGYNNISTVINVSQDPIGKTPRSNPATYIGLFDDIRELFSQTLDAKEKGITKTMFSFNTPGGRCEACQGCGVKRISMDFLPDVDVVCEVCHGKRYSDDVLSVEYKGKNIYDVLNMTIDEAYDFFKNIPAIKKKISALVEVGLGYMDLGQSSTTLSGGEAQRVKLANELQRKGDGNTLYILDEPTTGLHVDDIKKLISVLESLVDNGNTVLVIEHNLDLIKCADYIIDLGPDGGDRGGTIIATGTPEEVSEVNNSYTGQYLKKILAKALMKGQD